MAVLLGFAIEREEHREDENVIMILGAVVVKHRILKIKKFKLKHLKFSEFKILKF